MDAGGVLLGHDPGEKAEARRRANDTWPVIIVYGQIIRPNLGSGGFSVVVVEHASKSLVATDLSVGRKKLRREQFVIHSLMVSHSIVIVNVGRGSPAEVRLPQEDQPAQTFRFYGPYGVVRVS